MKRRYVELRILIANIIVIRSTTRGKEKKEQQSQDVSQHDVEQSSSNKESNDEQYEGKTRS